MHGKAPAQRYIRLVGGRAGVVMALLAIAVLIGAFLASAWRAREEAVDKATRQVNVVADALAVHARALFGAHTVALETLAHHVQGTDWPRVDSEPMRLLLRRVTDSLRHVNNILVVDGGGLVRASAHHNPATPRGVADRPYFAAHMQDPSPAVKVGPPIVSRLGGITVFTVSRRLEAPAGGFGGLILIGVKPQVFTDFYHTLDFDGGGHLVMFTEDGTVLARQPHLDSAVGAHVDLPVTLPSLRDGDARGSGVVTSPLDGTTRIVAYRRLPEFKLVVLAGLPQDNALAEWRDRIRGDAMLALPTALVLALVLGGLVAQNRVIRASEAAARANEERFRLITGTLPGVVFQFRMRPGGDFDYPFISPQIADVYGFPPEAVYHDPKIMFRSIVQDDVPKLFAGIEESRAGLAPWSQQWRLQRGGAIRHLRGQAVPHRSPDGGVVWDGVIVDITELIDARDALTAERQLFIGGPVIVFKWRPAPGWPVDYVSPNVEEQWGYRAAALLAGEPPYASLVHADDVARVEHEVRQLTGAGRPYFEQEYRIRRADGRVRWVYDFTLVGREADGSVGYLLGYLLDITERKEMERHIEAERDFIRTVINTLPGIFYVVDPMGGFEMVNDTMTRVSGYTMDEILAAGPLALLRPQDHAAVGAAIANVFRGGSAEIEASLVTKDGRELPYYFTGERFDSAGGPRLVGMGLDVSAHKRMEETIRKSNEELESFAYIASHDLQEPLRTVTTFLQLLKREYGASLPEEGIEYVDFAVDGALRMSHLIRDLLQYSRAGRGQVSTDARCDLSEVVDGALALLGTAIADSGAVVTSDTLPAVRGDTDQLTRLLQNLIGNALKYRDKARQATVHVGAEVSGGWVTVSVADNGIGIDPDYHDKIFQVFQRLHGRSEYEGTGIGLAICNKIIVAHGGRLWVESRLGEGATFRFTLRAA